MDESLAANACSTDCKVTLDSKASKDKNENARAFLRWVGGKRLLVHHLVKHLPHDYKSRAYFEPFAGAASLFFRLAPATAYLSDSNRHLIECYKSIRDECEMVIKSLKKHQIENSRSYYYIARDTYNRAPFGPAQAARFIYLNCTGFNGVFRVNAKGHYNVPFGQKPNPRFPTDLELRRVSKLLRHARLTASSFDNSLKKVGTSGFAYLDPPYPPLNGTSFFTHYTQNRFDSNDQERLASAVRDLHERGGLFLMTNADLPTIRSLYKNFNIHSLQVTRYVSCKGTRYKVGELVITNY